MTDDPCTGEPPQPSFAMVAQAIPNPTIWPEPPPPDAMTMHQTWLAPIAVIDFYRAKP